MEETTEKELERIQHLDQIRMQIQLILGSHIYLLFIAFVLFLAGTISFIYMQVVRSPYRYTARIALHYYPKETGSVRAYEEKFVVQICSSTTLRDKFFLALNNREFEDMYPSSPISIDVQKKKKSSTIDIVLQTHTEKEAIVFTNAYAHMCIQDYIERRTNDLESWEDAMKTKKDDIFEQIQAINKEKEELIAPINVIDPDKDNERLRIELANQLATRTKVNYVIHNLEARKKRLHAEMENVNPVLLTHQREIYEMIAELKKIDKEISVTQGLYTANNPKMLALLSRRGQLQEKYDNFLEQHKITQSDIETLTSIDKLRADYKAVESELETKKDELLVVESEMEENQKRVTQLTQIMPRYKECDQLVQSLLGSLKKIDASISDINYLMTLVKDDLFLTDEVTAAVSESPLRKKFIALAAFIAFVLATFVALLLCFLDYFFGTICNEKEMTLYPELHYLGKLPASKNLLVSDVAKELFFNTVCHKFQHDVTEHHVVLTGALPGARIMDEFYSAIEWNYAMAGKKFLTIDMVSADDIDDSLPLNDTGIVAYSGSKGVLPMTSPNYILPAEQELLKEDLQVLLKKYDLIFFRQKTLFNHDMLFMEQFSPLCDGLLVAVGLHQTYRKSVRSVVAFQKETGLPIMTLLSDGVQSHFLDLMNFDRKR